MADAAIKHRIFVQRYNDELCTWEDVQFATNVWSNAQTALRDAIIDME